MVDLQAGLQPLTMKGYVDGAGGSDDRMLQMPHGIHDAPETTGVLHYNSPPFDRLDRGIRVIP